MKERLNEREQADLPHKNNGPRSVPTFDQEKSNKNCSEKNIKSWMELKKLQMKVKKATSIHCF